MSSIESSLPLSQADHFTHKSVLTQEIVSGLNLHAGGHYLDATVGGGGHSAAILAAKDDVQVTAIDRDQMAIAAAQQRLAHYADRVKFWQGNYADFLGIKAQFDGIIADLGVSSPQLDQAERGFSFQQEAALDMRMDRSQSLTAGEIINHWQEVQLADMFYKYGEERFSRRIARKIVQQRPFRSTTELSGAIAAAVPPKYRYGRINPATRVFQALRIVVNDELGSLERFLQSAPDWLVAGGRIAVISFHSLEDRIVKHQFRNDERLSVITKKPITASETEQQQNPRSRSAKLRIAERKT